MQHRMGHPQKPHRAAHGHGRVRVVGVERAGAVRRGMRGRHRVRRRDPPRAGAVPVGEARLEIVVEVPVRRRQPGKRRVVGDRHGELADDAAHGLVAGHRPPHAQGLGDDAVVQLERRKPHRRQVRVLHVDVRPGGRHARPERRDHGQRVEIIDAEGVRDRQGGPVVRVARLGCHDRHPPAGGEGQCLSARERRRTGQEREGDRQAG